MWLRLRRNSTELRFSPGATIGFPTELQFGAATASHQVEGGDVHSDWWRFEREPGRVQCFGEFPNIVQDRKSDHWDQFPGDIQRLRELGLSTYRFSVDWSRVEPEEGRFDREALARYADMCRMMRENGIRPLVTLFHWSSPDWIWDAERSDKSGW